MEARRIATVAAIPFAPAESAYADKGSNRPTPEARERREALGEGFEAPACVIIAAEYHRELTVRSRGIAQQ